MSTLDTNRCVTTLRLVLHGSILKHLNMLVLTTFVFSGVVGGKIPLLVLPDLTRDSQRLFEQTTETKASLKRGTMQDKAFFAKRKKSKLEKW